MTHADEFAHRFGLAAALAAIGAGCSLTSGVELTRPSSGAAAPRGGPSFEAALSLPRTYRFVAGAEWTHAATKSSLWRAGGYFGYLQPPDPTSSLGWEATARAGLLRSWQEGTTAAGGFGGVRLGMLMRLGETAAPQGDALVEISPFLVVDVGMNGIMAAGQSLQPEVSARLLLRLCIGSALIP